MRANIDSSTFLSEFSASTYNLGPRVDNNDFLGDSAITKRSLMMLTGRNVRRRVTTDLGRVVSDEVTADGTPLSIIQWSKQKLVDPAGNECIMDDEQQAAFMAMTATFVLTYYNHAEEGKDLNLSLIHI